MELDMMKAFRDYVSVSNRIFDDFTSDAIRNMGTIYKHEKRIHELEGALALMRCDRDDLHRENAMLKERLRIEEAVPGV